MRGIKPSNISTRNGDTLEDDWPFFDDNDPVNTYNPLYLDAVVSNPPYSQKWDPEHKDNDARFSRFGLAPKSKADYAFLLHDLYHLKPDGIMAIILPHGVLFRGGEEGTIRKQLIENDHLDAIIGLPANIFFGTGIPTTILVLKQKRDNNDVLIVDASKCFAKDGKNNKLRASDIKKIIDTVNGRENVSHYSRVVPKDDIRKNEYNLNIPRYVDSSDPAESWDLYSSMFGGIPNSELDDLGEFWKAFPQLRSTLFNDNGTPYSNLKAELKGDDLPEAIHKHSEVQIYTEQFGAAFADFNPWLRGELIDQVLDLNVPRQESVIGDAIFARLAPLPLIDKYHAYQLLADEWLQIAIDLEILQTEGFEAARVVDPNMVTKKKKGKEVEEQEGWLGRILPFDLVQRGHHTAELGALKEKENRRSEIAAHLEEIIESLSEEDGEYTVLNDSDDKFTVTELNKELKELLSDVETDEIKSLNKYTALLDAKAKKPQKQTFIAEHPEVDWSKIEENKDGTYGKSKVNFYLASLRSTFEFPEGTFANKLVTASSLLNEEKQLKNEVKDDDSTLHLKTKETIENLSDEQVNELLEAKWILPLSESLHQLPAQQIDYLTNKLQMLVDKYEVTYADNAREIEQTEVELAHMITELDGNEFDLKGLAEMKTFLGGS